MGNRAPQRQSAHDAAVRAAGRIYEEHGKHAWTNPDGEKNKPWCGFYIDVIAVEKVNDTAAWVIEVETGDSVSESEAADQWVGYAGAYSRWFLAVPRGQDTEAQRLLVRHKISNCTVIAWRRDEDGRHSFWGLPGLK